MTGALADLWGGFGVALQPNNLLWSLIGVLIGNLIGVLPGLGALTAISMLLPLTYTLPPIPAILMLAGIFYGSQYGGAIGAILLNMPSHPPHAITCLDGFPLTQQGRGGAALGVAMLSSFFAASVGIIVMIFASPLLGAVRLPVRAHGDLCGHAARLDGGRHDEPRLGAQGRRDDVRRAPPRHRRHGRQ